MLQAVSAIGLGYVLGNLLIGEEKMFDMNKDMVAFHDEKVTLSTDDRKEMRKRRDTNREQMQLGLKRDGETQPQWNQSQGSYAMWTMTQDENSDYDVDDGAYFAYDDLKGPKGGDRSTADVKEMVRKAVDKTTFKKPPEVLKNCVRVYYNDGSHVDIPVYRIREDFFGEEYYELASTGWEKSDPVKVTEWFNKANADKSPDGEQLRLVVRLLKKFAKSRPSWKDRTVTGFMISKLVVDEYRESDRLDRALYDTMEAIRDRLRWNTTITHPVISGENLTRDNDQRPVFIKERLTEALDNLSVLLEADCTSEKAAKAWDKVFNTDYFSKRQTMEKSAVAASGTYSKPEIIIADTPKPWWQL